MPSRKWKTVKASKQYEKWQNQVKWHRKAKKNSKEQETLKINTEVQKSKKSSNST
jgi:hypothetical protein